MSPSKKPGKKPAPVRKAAVKAEPATAVLEAVPMPFPAKAESSTRGQQQEGRYVYGVIESRAPVGFGRSSIGGVSEEVYTVHYGDIGAVVSRTPVFIFDPTRDNALAHEHVIESVMKNYTIIPMSFGTVFRTDEDIREVLKSIYSSLKDVLKQMTG
ncbi:MAG TPA: GvpL/GvpF family gas vesicle protein, partial [Candidatus Angelobacter sp.]|nr:GvpL/GvpF family gas vesicle protein [Candidatus Angelobacter sp.]